MAEKEYIEREKLNDMLEDFCVNESFYDALQTIPAADVEPVRHGHWIEEYDCGYITPHCSECGETALTKEETSYDYVYSSYCPNCGAKMDEQ